ncbi:autophagy-related protein 18g isoform X1 [Cucumis melo var. makuwa]|uniref:Autophagy-related protein 18g isoform X1 n=1 Tax=Cucumis melo var. makuwa TaxID=1194695 RepID=A0A5D3CGC4_CUCMM|nr:autophagy-related protein 18g isoform X1 [Cucumis melo var. makuwa]
MHIHPSPAKSGTPPAKPDRHDVLRRSHPLLLIVAGEESKDVAMGQNHSPMGVHPGSCANSHNAVQFYSLKSHSYVHVLRFRSAVCMVRCSSQIVAVGLATQLQNPPRFYKEIETRPLKLFKWEEEYDFTQGRVSMHRKHFSVFAPGILGTYYKRLMKNKDLLEVSQKPFPTADSPYFHQPA